MKAAALARIVCATIAIDLLGMAIANSPAWSQSLIGDGLSAEKDPYSTYYQNGAHGTTGKGLAAHSGRQLPHRRHH
jgi:hypothetical protein